MREQLLTIHIQATGALATYFPVQGSGQAPPKRGPSKVTYKRKAVSIVSGHQVRGTYRVLTYLQPPPITNFFKPIERGTRIPEASSQDRRAAPTIPAAREDSKRPCIHLRGETYQEYILRTQTRSLGGVSLHHRARAARRLFPYKSFPQTRVAQDWHGRSAEAVVPDDGNGMVEEALWTPKEHQKLDEMLKGWARWEVNVAQGFVKSAKCRGLTRNESGVCRECEKLATRCKSFKKAVYRVSSHVA